MLRFKPSQFIIFGSILHGWGNKILRSYLNGDDWIQKLESDRKYAHDPDDECLEVGLRSSNASELPQRMRLLKKVDVAELRCVSWTYFHKRLIQNERFR